MSFSLMKYCFLAELNILTATGCSFTNPFQTIPYLGGEVHSEISDIHSVVSTHLPSPTIEIGLRLSTLYKFDEYPGPDGASGEASG